MQTHFKTQWTGFAIMGEWIELILNVENKICD